jgi:hypothetical protein
MKAVWRRVVTAMLAVGLLGIFATPGAAHAETLTYAGTYGAYGNVVMKTASNGGVYGSVYVKDLAADGACAHVALRWLQNNGTYYYDYGVYTCGLGHQASGTFSARNPTQYQSVDLQVWADGEARYTVRAQTF